jgi:predicted NAD/FAD-binding protein
MRTVPLANPGPAATLRRVKIAVIGSGISGLGAAHALAAIHDVTVFERDDRAGGHAHTVMVPQAGGGTRALDTGFLVHNRRNYPLLTRLFEELGVATQESEMSFSMTCRRCGISYAGRDLRAQRHHLRDPRMRRLGAEIVRFAATSRRWRDGRHRTRTLAQLAADEGYSDEFRDHFLVPFTAAIWSMPPGDALTYPADDALVFFANHNLLGVRRHTWRTVVGGSRTYVDAITDRLGDRVRLGTPVSGVRREEGGVWVDLPGGGRERFDVVVLATHTDQALALLAAPTAREAELLGAIAYTPNHAVLHTDTALLPPERSAWASWNYLIDDCSDPHQAPTVTYLLNRLQQIPGPVQYAVTLNRTDVAPHHVIAEMDYAHPRYTFRALRAQARLGEINGRDRVWFAGAYQRHGFHEDGLRSGIAVARALGATW